MDYKSFVATLKADKSGEFSALFCRFNQIDRDGDLILPTAFTHGQKVPMAWAHDWSKIVGAGSVRVTDVGAVYDGRFFLETQAGEEAYKTVKNLGEMSQWSWGFKTIDSAYEERAGKTVRVIKLVELFEVSPVLIGAGYDTQLLAIKGGGDNLKKEYRRLYQDFKRIEAQLDASERLEIEKLYIQFLRLNSRYDGS